MKKNKILKALKIIFCVVAGFFIVRYFYQNRETFANMKISVNPWVFIGAFLLYFVYKLMLASLFHYITVLDHAQIPYGEALAVYLYSILGKYIPGKVFMLAARIPAYQEHGVPARKTTICFFIENFCTLLGPALLFLASLIISPNDILRDYVWLAVGFTVLFFVCIHPKILNVILRLLGKIFKKYDMEIDFSYLQILKVVLLFVVNWIVVGTGFYLLVRSIYPVPASDLLYVAGVYGLGAIIGIITLFAPSGIGVRETVIVLGLAAIMPEEYAVVISVVSRLWATISELILIACAFCINQVRKLTTK